MRLRVGQSVFGRSGLPLSGGVSVLRGQEIGDHCWWLWAASVCCRKMSKTEGLDGLPSTVFTSGPGICAPATQLKLA